MIIGIEHNNNNFCSYFILIENHHLEATKILIHPAQNGGRLKIIH